MFISRLLVLSLLMSICVAAAAAQKPSDNIPGSFYSEPLSALSQDALANVRLTPTQGPIDLGRLYSPYAKPDSILVGALDWNIKPPQIPARVAIRAQNDTTCYAIRSYRVTRDDPASDSARITGYSTCQAATKFQVKEANDRQEIVPR